MRTTTIEREEDDQATAEQAAEYAVTFRLALIENLIDDDDNDVEEKDRMLLQTDGSGYDPHRIRPLADVDPRIRSRAESLCV
jgi:hypothetical protein